MVEIPDSHRDLLERPILVSLATLSPDGQPQVTPVWRDFDGVYLRINTLAGAQKHRNLHERPQATLLAVDPDDPYRYLEVRGRVAHITEEGAVAHMDALSQAYTGVTPYEGTPPGAVRLVCAIEPINVHAVGRAA